MKKFYGSLSITAVVTLIAIMIFSGCGGNYGPDEVSQTLYVEYVDPGDTGNGGGDGPDLPFLPPTGENGLNPIFSGELGVKYASASFGIIDPDPTGLTPCTDYDGDGIPNDKEISSNEYVADYPMIFTRIAPPVTMEIRVDETIEQNNYVETITNKDVTKIGSMDNTHYAKTKTGNELIPVEYTNENENSTSVDQKDIFVWGGKKNKWIGPMKSDLFAGKDQWWPKNTTTINSDRSIATTIADRTFVKDTRFDNVDYNDNLTYDDNITKDESTKRISTDYRSSDFYKQSTTTGPNNGYVKASLYIKNLSVNIPVRVSNILCTLAFETPSGEIQSVQSFILRDENWRVYTQDIYGGDEFGPYTIELKNLKTYDIKMALRNGYTPRIYVVSYDMNRVEDTNYDPGFSNLKIVEETAKGRTATIKIIGRKDGEGEDRSVREIYRVCAFDIDDDGNISPGISLKKALFMIFRDRVGKGEIWGEPDKNYTLLTVPDSGLKWKEEYVPEKTDEKGNPVYEYKYSSNTGGNNWSGFETYIKKYFDSDGVEQRIESIKRIGELLKYNPYDTEDNPTYNPNKLLTRAEIYKMKYWIILHNGHYFKGDINDPIWAGERYEVIFYDVGDFNQHFNTFSYTPLQTLENFEMGTKWDSLTNAGAFARSTYLGKVVAGEAIHLEVDLKQTRLLFDPNDPLVVEPGFAGMTKIGDDTDYGYSWNRANYTFQNNTSATPGIPQSFAHYATGGINSINVYLSKSEYAEWYEIIISRADYSKTIKVTTNELIIRDGIYSITRLTVDKDGNPIGKLAGDSTATGLAYNVDVYAYGICYGALAKTSSSTKGMAAYVKEPETEPGEFTFSAKGLTDAINVSISECDIMKAEYYTIKCTGPQNTGYTPKTRYIDNARAGNNLIEIQKPMPELPVQPEPGMYQISVTAYNDRGSAGSEPQYILVNYVTYEEQRERLAKVSTALYDQSAIDLEVNFNDGTGWYRLKLSYDDVGERQIPCRNSSYIEYDKQKAHIYFQPPDGTNSSYNVFTGGRKEADIFIRTCAEKKYRDNFWILMDDQSPNYFFISDTLFDLPGGKPELYWINNPSSDAALFSQNFLKNFYKTQANLLDTAHGSFALGSTVIGNYFFSPVEERIYSMKANIADKIVVTPGLDIAPPDPDSLTVMAGEDCKLKVSGMTSTYAESFEVFFRPDEEPSSTPNLRASPWHTTGEREYNPGDTCVIENLAPGALYTIAVVAYNELGNPSDPTFKTATTITDIPPDRPVGVTAEAGDDGKSIVVYNIYVYGISDYRVYWRKVGDTAWISHTINDQWGAVTYIIPNLSSFYQYEIQVSAISVLGGLQLESEKTDSMFVDLRTNSDFGFEAKWNDVVKNTLNRTINVAKSTGGSLSTIFEIKDWRSSLMIYNVTLPPETLKFDINYTVSYDEYTSSNYLYNMSSTPYAFSYTSSWNAREMTGASANNYAGASLTISPNFNNIPVMEVFTGVSNYPATYGKPASDSRIYLLWNTSITATIKGYDINGNIIGTSLPITVLVPPPDISPANNIAPDAYEGTTPVMVDGQTLVMSFHNATDKDYIRVSVPYDYIVYIETYDAPGQIFNARDTVISSSWGSDDNSGEGFYSKLAYKSHTGETIEATISPANSSCLGYYTVSVRLYYEREM